MKLLIAAILTLLIVNSYSQSVFVKKLEEGNKKFLVITIDKKGELSKNYWPSCYFGDVTKLPDSTRLSIIEQLLAGINNDTSHCYKSVEALSYKYNGRYNKIPKSTIYNIQVAALVLINYIAFSSDAVNYSPFPVLIDKKSKKEFATTGKELKAVIKDYQKWFEKIKQNGFNDYPLPLMSKKYEWYGSLYTRQRIFDSLPAWTQYDDCPILKNERD